MGYSRTQKGYKCSNPQSRRYVVSADVTFFESMSFFTSAGGALGIDVLTQSLSIPLPIPPLVLPTVTPLLKVYHRCKKPPRPTRLENPPAPLTSSLTSPEIHQSSDLPIALRKGIRSCTQHPID